MKITLDRVLNIALLIGLLVLFQRQSAAPVIDNPSIQLASYSARQVDRVIVYEAGEIVENQCATGFRILSAAPTNFVVECKPAPRTATPSSTANVTDVPSETVEPTATQDYDETATPPSGLQAWEVWHAPGAHILPDGNLSNVHEHGDAPPQWVNDYTVATFDHPLIYGGDERSSEAEVTRKHQAYGGFNFAFTPNGCSTEGYVRYHASSTPADRAGMIHSFEIYVRDCAGNISFNQGVYWIGDPAQPAQRMCRADEVPNGRDQYIIAGRCKDDTAISEQWYTHFVNWDFSITLLNATTFFEYDEHLADPMNQDTWQLTGRNELTLRVEITSLPNPRVSLPREYNYPRDAWWCAQRLPIIGTRNFKGRTLPFPYWQITGAVDSPADCPAGFLPQYNASTMPAIYAGMDGGNTIPRIYFDGAEIVEVPN